MTTESETKVTAGLRKQLAITTGLVQVLRHLYESRNSLVKAVALLDEESETFNDDNCSSVDDIRDNLNDAIVESTKATAAVEYDVFDELESALENADDFADDIDGAAEDAADTLAQQSGTIKSLNATIGEQSESIETLTSDLNEANGILEMLTAPGAELVHVDTLIIAEVYLVAELPDLEDEAAAGTSEEAEAGVGVEADAGEGIDDEPVLVETLIIAVFALGEEDEAAAGTGEEDEASTGTGEEVEAGAGTGEEVDVGEHLSSLEEGVRD